MRHVFAVCLALSVASGCRLDEPAPGPVEPDPPAERALGTDPLADGARPAGERRAHAAPSGWVVPVVGVAPGDLVDTFQAARSEGRTHDALDITAPLGTPVVAASAGVVARLFTSDKGGLTVYALSPDGQTVCYYAHLDAYAPGLAEGQTLRPGDPIGTVGTTGNADPDGPHLHFAVWSVERPGEIWDGTALNPYRLLTGPRSR